MKSVLTIALNTSPAQAMRLAELQRTFAAVCNALAPLVQKTRCWNRVALHHMAYRLLRQQFPGLGSQMVCNAIYSVSRSCRVVYQHPQSPFNVAHLGERPLPRLQFLPQSPVYFDRHTLSIKDGQVSMFTLDGRMRFQLDVSAANERRFRHDKLREIVLDSKAGVFRLNFHFAQVHSAGNGSATDTSADADADDPVPSLSRVGGAELPEYVLITDDALAAPAPMAQPSPARLPT